MNKRFTINELFRFSGIKPHTLRAWERRYSLLKPFRAENNSRLYTLDELTRILDIALLKKNGYRISLIATCKDIEEKVRSLSDDNNEWQKAVNELIVKMYLCDSEHFEKTLDKFVLSWPIDIFIEQIIYPFLKTTCLLWIGHKLFEEHLVVTAIRKKLILAIESVKSNPRTDKTVLLFLPDTKQLDLGLLYSNYFLKKRGIRVLYMGNDITIQNLKSIFFIDPPAYLFTYLPQNYSLVCEQLLSYIESDFPSSKLIIGSYSPEYSTSVFNNNLIEMNYTEALHFLQSR